MWTTPNLYEDKFMFGILVALYTVLPMSGGYQTAFVEYGLGLSSVNEGVTSFT